MAGDVYAVLTCVNPRSPCPPKAAPYTMVRQGPGPLQYEGFCVDLLQEIADSLGFSYSIRLASDGQHGKWDPDREKWTGMVGELLDQVGELLVHMCELWDQVIELMDHVRELMHLGGGTDGSGGGTDGPGGELLNPV